MSAIMIRAGLTGLFCAAFAFGIDWLTDMLAQGYVLALSFMSGALGSLFSSLVLARMGRD